VVLWVLVESQYIFGPKTWKTYGREQAQTHLSFYQIQTFKNVNIYISGDQSIHTTSLWMNNSCSAFSLETELLFLQKADITIVIRFRYWRSTRWNYQNNVTNIMKNGKESWDDSVHTRNLISSWLSMYARSSSCRIKASYRACWWKFQYLVHHLAT
jgi:hypothetical protein